MSVIGLQVSEPRGPRSAKAEVSEYSRFFFFCFPQSKFCCCQVYSFGAHVTSWRDCTDAEHVEYLFLSKTAILDGSKPIRGGIPICWPQFGSFGAMSAHGFARNRVWTLVSQTHHNSEAESSCVAVFSLGPTEPVDAWPHSCSLQYRVILSWAAGEQSSRLKCELAVTNVGSSALSFTGALHAYFTVSDISNASVSSLSGLSYLDQLQKGDDSKPKRLVSSVESEHFTCEFDRIYQDAFRSEQQHTLQIHDSGLNRSINVCH
jgi:glucose-6-phosphate 1-epimerase